MTASKMKSDDEDKKPDPKEKPIEEDEEIDTTSDDRSSTGRDGDSTERPRLDDGTMSSKFNRFVEIVFCRRIGLWLICASALFIALSRFFMKLESKFSRPTEIVFIRFLLQVIMLAPVVLILRKSFVQIKSNQMGRFIMCCLCKAFSQGACYYAISLIRLADSAVLYNTQPIFVCFIAWLWLGEAMGVYEIVVSVVTLVGVVLVCHPVFLFGETEMTVDLISRSSYIWGTVIALLAAVFGAIGNCILRRLTDIHYSFVVFTQGLVALPLTMMILFATSSFSLPSEPVEYAYLAVIPLFAVVGRCLEAKSLQSEEATPVTILKTLEIPVALFLESVFLFTSPSVLSIAGTILVIGSVTLISVRSKITDTFRRLCSSRRDEPVQLKCDDHDESEGITKSTQSSYGTK